MIIIVDAMGADNSPDVMVTASVKAVKEFGVNIKLVGREDEINRVFEANPLSRDGIEIVNAEDVITMHDEPISVRKKTESSLAKSLNMLKNGEGDALVSAGNSGALLVGATLFVRCIKGVRRAAMAPVMPVKGGLMMIVDSGANLDCKPEMLEQFAVMGSVYMKNIHGIASPRVGLANNGAEETKGPELYIETHKLLKQNTKINFVGNVEGRGLPLGECDVAVADGFTGNMILKTYEGAGKMISEEVKNIFTKNIITKIGALFVMKGIKEFRKRMDYKEIGGAMLLGISKPVIKAHGSSDEKGFFNSIRQAVNLVKTDVIPQIEAAMEKEETNV